jgi:hypothetical protein
MRWTSGGDEPEQRRLGYCVGTGITAGLPRRLTQTPVHEPVAGGWRRIARPVQEVVLEGVVLGLPPALLTRVVHEG